MSQLAIQKYLNDLSDLKRVSGMTREGIVSEAFKDLLKAYAKEHDLVFLAQYELPRQDGNRRIVDGALVYDLRVPFGYWEAKDEKDDLDAEIAAKLQRGYPRDNIIFEDSRHAVLMQNGNEVVRCKVADTDKLEHVLNLFFKYERPEIAEFRRAVVQFQTDLPAVLSALREMIEKAQKENAAFNRAANKFLKHAQETINPVVTAEDVSEMLIQHVLTEEIFSKVFDEDDFHRQNNIAKELYALESLFFTGALKKNTLRALESYYTAIRTTAHQIMSHSEKQTFLKVIYEGFYKVYNKKAADRLGVVYTPNEIVRFMVESADWLCQKHFRKALIDNNVEILDPATGTGTFICELLEHFRGQPKKLAHKYKEELHANEVAILPYYVANLNIEATYAAIAGHYEEFQNLCFVDTLDNVAALGKHSGYQETLFGAVSEENVERIKRQNKRKISVIIGNPPYNANQQNENDENKNRTYPRIDARIKDSYIKNSTAQKTKLYDMYARFFRWASDRLRGDGIVAFITNRGFLDKRNFDGFRRVVEREFSEILVLDLGGDWKEQGFAGGGNVFGIGTGVAISFFIKKGHVSSESHRAAVKYANTGAHSTDEKIDFVNTKKISDIEFETIKPDKDGWWLNQITTRSANDLPLISKAVKARKVGASDHAIFQTFGIGVSSNRDDWVYDLDDDRLERKMTFFASQYASQKAGQPYTKAIKWSRNLKRNLEGGKKERFDADRIGDVLYRPFVLKRHYDSPLFVDERGLRDDLFAGTKNDRGIAFSDPTSQKPWFACATRTVPDLHFVGGGAGTLYVSQYRYGESKKDRADNVTNWALDNFKKRYENKGSAAKEVTKKDIFHYVYAVMHDPVYRETYARNLKREFPRIPFYKEFWRWSEWGQTLMEMHVAFNAVTPYPLKLVEKVAKTKAGVAPRVRLKSDKVSGVIVIDSDTQLTGVPKEAWDYVLGIRSAIDWVLDQFKERKPSEEMTNAKMSIYKFADHKEEVIDLLRRVTRVSVETMEIVEQMRALKR